MFKAEKILVLFSKCSGSRDIYAMDGQVGLGALSKGRSASPSLNAELSRSVPTNALRSNIL